MGIRELSPELARKAQDDLGETADRIQTDINALRCWIDTQNHLISSKDDQFLLTFLRRCNFDLEATKKRIDSFLTCKTTSPDIYKYRRVDATVLEILKCGLVTIPPNSMPNNGPRIIISHFCKFDPKKHSLRDIVKFRFMLFEILAFKDDIAAISGAELVFDLKNCSLKQAFYLEPSVLKKAVFYQEQCTPLRIKNIHIINMRKELQSIVQLARSIISSTTTEIPILVHENESDLYEFIPQESMPIEYGGKNGTQEEFQREWKKVLQDHKEYFEMDTILGTDEKLRKQLSVSSKKEPGLRGSFRKLEID